MKNKSDHTSRDKVKLFRKDIVVVKEEWFADMNLTGGAIFLTSLIKGAKLKINKIIDVTQSDTYTKFQQILIGTHRLSRYCMKNVMVTFIFKGSFLTILPNPVKLSHKRVLKHFKYQEPYFTLYLLIVLKKNPLKSL